MPLGRFRSAPIEHKRNPLPEGAKAESHLILVRQCPCVVCGKEPCGFAHHLLKPEPGVRGQKKSMDKWATPLCFDHHDPRVKGSIHFHGGEEDWFALHDIDGRALAKGLWTARGNLDQMWKVVRLHRDLARLKRQQREYPGL